MIAKIAAHLRAVVERDIDQLVLVQRTNVTESLMRLAIIGLQTALISYLLALPLLLLWYAVFVVGTALSRYLTGCLTHHRSPALYLATVCVEVFTIVVYRLVTVYFWLHPEPMLNVMAVVILAASILFSVSQRANITVFNVLDLGTNMLLMAFFALTLALADAPSQFDLVAIGGLVGLMVYNWLIVSNIWSTRKSLQRAGERSLQAQKMEAVGRLTGGVAHDFNNILTVVMGNLELYEEIDDPKERAELVRKAHDAATRAAVLTGQLLAFSRQTPMTHEVVDTRSFLAKLSELTERVLPATIQMHTLAATNIVAMRVDRAQLEVALLNLVINARDAMPDGGLINLTASSHTQKQSLDDIEAGAYVRLDVQDEGTGIADDMIDKVFEPFFTTKPVGKGSGLGLPMVKGFAEQSGGHLMIESAPGKGTCVSILIPANAPAQTAGETALPLHAALS